VSALIECREHGAGESAAVCAHILETLRDGVPRGFCCTSDEADDYQAICSGCQEMDQAEWDRVRSDLHVIICRECCRKAAAINGYELSFQ
jgi:hypothetical protein